MEIVDLSHPMETGMPFFPGTDPPAFDTVATVEKEGWLEKTLVCSSHTGTHVDAPAHILSDRMTLDRMPMERFFGSGLCLDVSGIDGNRINVPDLEPYGEKLKCADFALIRTGWSMKWGTADYFRDHPCLSTEGAEYLASFHLSGAGIDTSSFDAVECTRLPVHRTLLGRGYLLIENLNNLDSLPPDGFEFGCFPLKLIHADGSPVRAFAVLPDTGAGS